jgi:hypothetical protein
MKIEGRDANLTVISTINSLHDTKRALKYAISRYSDSGGITVDSPDAHEILAIVNMDLVQAHKHITKAIATLEAWRL